MCPKIHKTAYGRKSSFRIIDRHLSSEECCIREGTLEVSRSSCTSWWCCERRFRLLCIVHRTRFISITSDGSKKSWTSFKATPLRRTSSGRSICLHSSQDGDAPKLLKIPKSECPDIWIRLPRHKMAKSWSIKEDPVVLLLWIGARLGKSSKLRILIRAPRKRIILICARG